MSCSERVRSWTLLIREARAGSPEALDRLLTALRPYLLFIAQGQLDLELLPKAGASDLVQETLLHAHQANFSFQGESRAELLGWLRQILLNNLANLRRRHLHTEKREVGREVPLRDVLAGRVPVKIPADHHLPHEDVIKSEDLVRLEKALELLSPEDRELVVLRSLELRSFKEIGIRRNLTEKAAHYQWVQAIKSLQVLLNELKCTG